MATQLSQAAQSQSCIRQAIRWPSSNENLSLGQAYHAFNVEEKTPIPLQVWLLESSKSPMVLPGRCDRFTRQCFHILLNRSTTLNDHAFVQGFIMGSDPRTTKLHILLFKQAAQSLYPKAYRFSDKSLNAFSTGFRYGREPRFRNFYRLQFEDSQHLTLAYLRRHLEITVN